MPLAAAVPGLGLAESPTRAGDTVLETQCWRASHSPLRPSTYPLVFPLPCCRPLLRGLLLQLRTAALGVAGPFCAAAWLPGPGRELCVVPGGWTARSVLVGRAASPSAWRVEAVRTSSLLSPLGWDFISAVGGCAFHP